MWAAFTSHFDGRPRSGKILALAPASLRLIAATSPDATEKPPITTAPVG